MDEIQDNSREKVEVKATPLPWKPLLVVILIVMSEATNLVILFPFVVFMVRDFGITDNEDRVGFYVGILASAFPFAQVISSLPIGLASDKFGRKPILMIGILGASFAMLGFGLSTNFYAALTFRLIGGLLNGNIGVAKSVLGDVTDKTNQTRAFSVIGFVFGAALIIAPAIGGYTSDPAGNYPNSIFADIKFFTTYKYFLPPFFGFLVGITGFILGMILLKETLPSKSGKEEEDTTKIVVENIESPIQLEYDSNSELIEEESKKVVDDIGESSLLLQPTLNRKKTIWGLIKDPKVIGTISLYTFISFITIIGDEIYAIWAVDEINSGGLNFSSEDIGLTLAIGGVFLLCIQLLVFPKLCKWFGSLRLYQLSLLFLAAVYFSLPYINIPAKDLYKNKEAGNDILIYQIELWGGLMLILFVRFGSNVCAFTSAMLCLNNSVYPENLGSINGLGQMTSSLFRAAGPFIAGFVYSFSLSQNLSFPLNFHLIFILNSILCIIAFLVGFILPRSLDKPLLKQS
eukprot:TRINITY_DN233_c0_g3_i1.p1 TRINITY_DN233_c0_g3~~TRINITY_DN233_c0_g3_i1.p1  ORF type:complete len:517 (+),score=122.42 TRINITY_DN233_c0_g3_i1:87-1637(+)